MQARAREVMLKKHAAIGNGIEKRLSKVESRMPSHGRPESNPACQSELRVAPEQILFRKSDRDERHEPQPAPPRQFQSVQGNGAERISAKRGNRAEQ